MRSRAVLVLGVGLLALCSSEAAANPSAMPVRLQYALGRGAEQCPDASAMRETVAAHLGYVPWLEAASRTIVVAVSREGSHLRARVELRERDGSLSGVRELASTNSDCRELAAAIELAVSIAIDPLSLARRPPPPVPAHDGEPAPEPMRSGAAAAAPVPRVDAAARRLGFSASVGGVVAFGSAPSVAGGITFQGRLRIRSFSVALEGRVDFPAYRDAFGGEVSSSLILGAVHGCYHRWHVMGCGMFAAGGLRAAGHHLADEESHTEPYLAAGLRVGGEIPLFSIFSLRLHADLLAAFSRITLRTTATQEEIWTTPPVSGALGLALLGSFL